MMGRPKNKKDAVKRKNRSFWTCREEQEFKDLYHQKSTSELMSRFDKSESAIRQNARNLGLIKLNTYQHLTFEQAYLVKEKGVYGICNKYDDKVYIGHSNIGIGQRIKQHYNNLQNKKHHNLALQRNWTIQDTLGHIDQFYIIVIFTSSDEQLNSKKEQEYIIGLGDLTYNKNKHHVAPPKLTDDKILDIWTKINWTKINKQEIEKCWEWIGTTDRNGYGSLQINKKYYLAHRLIYYFHYNVWPNGLVVRHKCDNRKCCNPHHLELGTDKDNARDTINRGRNNPAKSRFTEQDVDRMVALLQEGKNYVEIGKIFNCTCINTIFNGKIKSLKPYIDKHKIVPYTASNLFSPSDIIDICELSKTRPIKEISQRYGLSINCIKNLLLGKTSQHVLPQNYNYERDAYQTNKGDGITELCPNSEILESLVKLRLEKWYMADILKNPNIINSGLIKHDIIKIVRRKAFRQLVCDYFSNHYDSPQIRQVIIGFLLKKYYYIIFPPPRLSIYQSIHQSIRPSIDLATTEIATTELSDQWFSLYRNIRNDKLQHETQLCTIFIEQYDINNLFPKVDGLCSYSIADKIYYTFTQKENFNKEQMKFTDELDNFVEK